MPDRSRSFQEQADEAIVLGERKDLAADLFHLLLRASWLQVLGAYVALYLLANALFALGYLLTGGIANARPGSFADAFWFSVQTLGTIGYGIFAPQGTGAHLLVTAESLCGTLLVAMVAGVTFAKFSVPRARVRFTDKACIAPFDGVPTLMLRVGNERRDLIVNVEVTLLALRPTRSTEGHAFYRADDLKVRRNRLSALTRSWTVLCPFEEGTLLHGMTQERFAAEEWELQVTLVGTDSISGQPVNASHGYEAQDLCWDCSFADILTVLPDGRTKVDLRKFDTVLPLPTSRPGA